MRWSELDIPDQSGKVAVVTGANSGIGFETARALAEKGASVVIGCRSKEKGLESRARIQAAAESACIRFQELDLSSLASIESFSDSLSADLDRIDILCNNAGVMMPPYGQTIDGFELQFGTNHLGHFALTGRLMELLRGSAAARVVSVSSLAHHFGRVNFEDLNSETRYDAMRAYGQSKLANLLFTRELQERFEMSGLPALALAAHPGSTRTNLQQHSSLMAGLVALFSQEPSGGALPTLYAATSPDAEGGAYYGPTGLLGCIGPPGPARSSLRSRDGAAADRLWKVSEEMTGVRYAI